MSACPEQRAYTVVAMGHSDRDKLIALAGKSNRESRQLDFKREFDSASNEAWCELIKDIVAFANSGGGIIVFGAESDGASSGIDCTGVMAVDPADVTNRIFKYTGYQFADLEFAHVLRAGLNYSCMVIAAVDVPIIFTKPGTYDIGGGKQKTAFSQGSIYFRHGAKSEPGSRDDLVKWQDRELAKQRRVLLKGMRKVVEAPRDHVVMVAPISGGSGPAPITARITSDPNAARVAIQNTDELWPYRQKELLARVNARLSRKLRMNGHALRCVNWHINALGAHPEFIHKPHKLASPQYSEAYVEWLIGQISTDAEFIAKCREAFRREQNSRRPSARAA